MISIFECVKRRIKRKPPLFRGNFSSWQSAQFQSTGYQSKIILEKAASATRKVLNGEGVFERDSVVFHRCEYIWELLSVIFMISGRNNQSLNLIDFGGGLGGTYFQHKELLSHIELKWNIIDQPHFVDYGKKNLETNELKFYNSLEDCLKEQSPQIILLSNVLQYLEFPYQLIGEVTNSNIPWVFINNTLTMEPNHDERISIQYVPQNIYPNTTIPVRLLSEEKLKSQFLSTHKLIFEFENEALAGYLEDKILYYFKGFLFEKVS